MGQILRFLLIFLLLCASFLFAKQKGNERSPETIGLVERMDINNINLPLRNDGKIGQDGQTWYPNGQNTLSILFSGGFAVTGYINGELRASWMATASIIEEWQAGKWGMDPADTLAKFYVVNSTDYPGSPAYIEWANAVALGADFQDINGDGQYDPYTDRPDILGHRTIWTVFSDSTSLAQRSPRLGTLPLGLEIHQTTWAYYSGTLSDVIFFRYRLINRGNNNINSLIFSIWEDPDIGDYTDDLIGCKPSTNLGYCYNDGFDNNYGQNPPAFGIQLIQGPVVNSPGSYAILYRGPFFGFDTLYDKTCLPMTSFSTYIQSSAILGDPYNASIARYYQEGGLDENGNPIDPTQWGVGGTVSTNPKYFYSGDPITLTGWMDNSPADKRFLLNMGPFNLAAAETQDIIIAYVAGRGYNALNSLEIMQDNAQAVVNFIGIPTSIDDNKISLPDKFTLEQNYPNPFNPGTTIPFTLGKSADVSLKIFNIVGQEVRTLVNGRKDTGQYTLQWDGRDNLGRAVASGIYFYKLSVSGSENLTLTRKMILMK